MFIDKLKALLVSRRFLAAATAIIVVLINGTLGIPEDTLQPIIAVVIAWIIGDSINKTEEPESIDVIEILEGLNERLESVEKKKK